MKRVNICLTVWLIESLQKAAKSTGLSMSDIIRRAVEQYLEKMNQ